jgi:acetyl-CoA carboxylase biotin carboxyl carrier protein
MVTEDTTVCIVEVMKLMNRVKANTTGRITHVLIENGNAIEKGQALFLVARD